MKPYTPPTRIAIFVGVFILAATTIITAPVATPLATTTYSNRTNTTIATATVTTTTTTTTNYITAATCSSKNRGRAIGSSADYTTGRHVCNGCFE